MTYTINSRKIFIFIFHIEACKGEKIGKYGVKEQKKKNHMNVIQIIE